MLNLVAYIPVLNKRFVDWLRKYPESILYLISQEEAEKLLPRLARMRTIGLPTDMIAQIIDDQQLVCRVYHGVHPDFIGKVVMPDEDVSHAFAKNLLKGADVSFEKIWARYDMTFVKANQPVLPDMEITVDHFYKRVSGFVQEVAQQSPDWWRQVGAAIVINKKVVAFGFNKHFPSEYEQDALGDPRLNYEAGQAGEYLALHAERSCIYDCSKNGIQSLGSEMIVTCFPCLDCSRAIVQAGIKRVYFVEGYSNMEALAILKNAGVSVVKINM